jgi:uncharacterized phage infection (PIP) family protein YhgE
VVLASIALMVLVARDARLSENWHDAYAKSAAATVKALEQRDKFIEQRDQAKAMLTTSQQTWLAEKAALEEKVKDRDGQIATIQKEKADQATQLTTLGEQFKGLNDKYAVLIKEKDALATERNLAKKEADDLRVMYAELNNRQQVALGQLNDLRETLRQTAEEKAAAESRIQGILQANPGVKLPEEVTALPTTPVNGLVTAADNEAKVAQVSVGSDDGVVKGMKLYVYDAKARKYLATLTVSKVEHDSAAGDLSVVRGAVEKNCHVTNRFE